MDISLYSQEMAHVMIQLISAYEVEVTASLRALNPAKASYYDSSNLIHTIVWTKGLPSLLNLIGQILRKGLIIGKIFT